MTAEIKRITLYKIKPNLNFEQYLVDSLQSYDHVIEPSNSWEGYIKYVNPAAFEKTEESIPWLRFLNSGFDETKYAYSAWNKFPRAIMALKFVVAGQARHFVATFGQHADTLFDKTRIVRDFGIKVGMNICDVDKLRRIQTSSHEAVSRQTERQAGIGTNLRVFGINTDSEFLRTISGHVKSEYRDIVDSFRGRDSISIKLPRGRNIQWGDLVSICTRLDAMYYSDAYRNTDFRVYDTLRHENDPEIIATLDDILCAKLIAKNFNKIHLSPPEFIETDETDFAYSHGSEGNLPPLFEDIRIEDLVSTPGRRLKDLTASRIRSWKIFIYDSEQGRVFQKWNAYECLVAEVDLGESTYVLSNNQWREVSLELKENVTSYLTERITAFDAPYLPCNINIFDETKNQNREEVYNRAAAQADPSVFLFDKGKINIAGRGLYEICDLFHLTGHFVHVKRYTSGTSSISHIFTQTKLYSHAFAVDEETRKSFNDWIDNSTEPENQPKNRAAFKGRVPLRTSDVDERSYTVVFCILHDKDAFQISDLPFMSQYELMLTHRFLTEDRRYNVGIVFRKILTNLST